MEKFERVEQTFPGMVLEARLDVMAGLANDHSDAIEENANRIDGTQLLQRHRQNRQEDVNDQLRCEIATLVERGGRSERLQRETNDQFRRAISSHADMMTGLWRHVRELEKKTNSLVRCARYTKDIAAADHDLIRELERRWGCRIPPGPLRWSKTVTTEEAVAVIEAERDRLQTPRSTMSFQAWTHYVAGRMVEALRKHGREGA